MSLLGMVMLPSGQVVPNPYCGLQFTLTLHNVIDVDTFIWHTTMCLIMTLLSWDVHYQVAAFASPAATAPSSAHFHFQ